MNRLLLVSALGMLGACGESKVHCVWDGRQYPVGTVIATTNGSFMCSQPVTWSVLPLPAEGAAK